MICLAMSCWQPIASSVMMLFSISSMVSNSGIAVISSVLVNVAHIPGKVTINPRFSYVKVMLKLKYSHYKVTLTL